MFFSCVTSPATYHCVFNLPRTQLTHNNLHGHPPNHACTPSELLQQSLFPPTNLRLVQSSRPSFLLEQLSTTSCPFQVHSCLHCQCRPGFLQVPVEAAMCHCQLVLCANPAPTTSSTHLHITSYPFLALPDLHSTPTISNCSFLPYKSVMLPAKTPCWPCHCHVYSTSPYGFKEPEENRKEGATAVLKENRRRKVARGGFLGLVKERAFGICFGTSREDKGKEERKQSFSLVVVLIAEKLRGKRALLVGHSGW